METRSALYSLDDLIEMKRSELQRLAKMYNIKANQKNSQLIKHLTDYYNTHISVRVGASADPGKGRNNSVGLEENSHDSNDDDNQEIIINLPTVHNSDPEEQVRRRQIEKELESRLEKKGLSRIPRFTIGVSSEISSQSKKTLNRNWTKLHNRSFSRMDSIDEYLQKKRQRANNLTKSINKAKLAAESAKSALETMRQTHNTPKTPRTPKTPGRNGTFTPKTNTPAKTPVTKVMKILHHSNSKENTGKKSYEKPFSPFKPKVFGINAVKFQSKLKTPSTFRRRSPRLEGVEQKKEALVKPTPKVTPKHNNPKSILTPRMSVCNTAPQQKKINSNRKTMFDFRSPVANANSCPRKKFDLAESLKKKLPYKPYSGALKDTYSEKASLVLKREERRESKKVVTTHRRSKQVNAKRGLDV